MFFWIVVITQVPQNGAAIAFQSNLADMQRVTRGTSELAAGYNTSIQGIIPIVLTPVVGIFIDRVGYRMWFCKYHSHLGSFACRSLTNHSLNHGHSLRYRLRSHGSYPSSPTGTYLNLVVCVRYQSPAVHGVGTGTSRGRQQAG